MAAAHVKASEEKSIHTILKLLGKQLKLTESRKPIFIDGKYYKYYLLLTENYHSYIGINDMFGYSSYDDPNIDKIKPADIEPTKLIFIYNIQINEKEKYLEIVSKKQCIMLKYYNNIHSNEYQMHLTFVNSNEADCTYPKPTKLQGAFKIIFEIMKPLDIPLYVEDDASISKLVKKMEIKTRSEYLLEARSYGMNIDEYMNSDLFSSINTDTYFKYTIRNYRILMQNKEPSIYSKFGAVAIDKEKEALFNKQYETYKLLVRGVKPMTEADALIILDTEHLKVDYATRTAKLQEFKLTDPFLKELFKSAEDGIRNLIIYPHNYTLRDDTLHGGSSKQKYLKYKNKYLQLKNKLNNL
jgi:hypothetical protein